MMRGFKGLSEEDVVKIEKATGKVVEEAELAPAFQQGVQRISRAAQRTFLEAQQDSATSLDTNQ